MFRKAIAIVLLIGLLVAHVQAVLTLAAFDLNREYIAKSLCVKKTVRKNCCLGKCHLKKELKEETDREASPNFERTELARGTLGVNTNVTSTLYPREQGLLVEGCYHRGNGANVPDRIFHPPC